MSSSVLDRLVAELDLAGLVGAPLQDKALALSQINQLLKDLGVLKHELVQLIAESMAMDTETIPGVGTLVRRQLGKRIKWEGGRILYELVRNFVPVDEDTGEALSGPEAIAEKAMRQIYECGGLHRPSHGWSVSSLKAKGLKPGSYSDYEERGQTVDLV